MSSICLNMIVKNEAHVIRRCLDSVRPLITTWCIVDTGSTDGTQELIRDLMKDLPGQLHQSDWKGFGASRTEAVHHARGQADYLFFIDADAELMLPEGFVRPELTADAYYLQHRYSESAFSRLDLVATRRDWRYVGVLHEALDCGGPFSSATLPGPFILERPEGARSRDPRKYEKDAEVLEQVLREQPGDPRTTFYLAQSYRDAGRLELALETYRQRVSLGGWDEETFVALLRIAQLLETLARPEAEVVHAYLLAHEARPGRAETLGRLACYLRAQRHFQLALLFAERGMALPVPSDLLFVEPAYHLWRCLDEFAVATYWVGRYQDSLAACDRLLSEGHLPASQVERVTANRDFALQHLK